MLPLLHLRSVSKGMIGAYSEWSTKYHILYRTNQSCRWSQAHVHPVLSALGQPRLHERPLLLEKVEKLHIFRSSFRTTFNWVSIAVMAPRLCILSILKRREATLPVEDDLAYLAENRDRCRYLLSRLLNCASAQATRSGLATVERI